MHGEMSVVGDEANLRQVLVVLPSRSTTTSVKSNKQKAVTTS
jgi:hypothetical protein